MNTLDIQFFEKKAIYIFKRNKKTLSKYHNIQPGTQTFYFINLLNLLVLIRLILTIINS
jgi:hypothetical protein